MTSKSPGSDNSQGSRIRPLSTTVGQSTQPSSQQSQVEDRLDSRQLSSIQLQPQIQLLQQNITIPQRTMSVSPLIRGGVYSPDLLRLIGYTSPITTPSSTTFNQAIPQISYPKSLIQPPPQSSPSPFQSISSTISFGTSQAPAPLSSTLWSIPQTQVSAITSTLPSRASLPSRRGRASAQAYGRRFSPPPVSYVQALQDTTTPQVRAAQPQSLLPSITALSLDNPMARIQLQRAVSTSSTRSSFSAETRSSVQSPNSDISQPDSPSTRSSFSAETRSSVQSPNSDISQPDSPSRPLPQNLRGDPFRSAKVKTELCRKYNTPKGCAFGDKCNYAHGEHELKFNKLVDLEAAGLVDLEVFRCHVCFTWVATGACPFDQRCTRLHDPRVVGMQPSWLPHAEVMINNTKKGGEVDKLYHQQYSSIYSCSPLYGFAPKVRWKADEASTHSAWKEFYSFCCNMDTDQPYSQGTQWRLSTSKKVAAQDQVEEITEKNRLEMALLMRERRLAQDFVYLPTHIFNGELCLVLQKCYFRLEVTESYKGIRRYGVVEILREEATSRSADQVTIVAQEIAFGPVADASVRPVSVWFNINPEDISPCTRQQARRHKRSRHRLRAKRNDEKNKPDEKSCPIPPFTSHQPIDGIAFNLITGIQTHRYRALKYFSSLSRDEDTLRLLALEEEMLRKSFESQRRFWMTWTWPKKVGSSQVSNNTEVPDIDGTYNFVTYGDPGYGEDSIFFGHNRRSSDDIQVVSKQAKLAKGFIWKSYIMNLQLLSGQGAIAVPKEAYQMPTHDPLLPSVRRMTSLRSLSLGFSVSSGSSRFIPRISHPYTCTTTGFSLNEVIQEWTLTRRQHEENSSQPLRDAQKGKATLAQRRPISYASDMAATSWTREIPRISK